MRQTSSLTTTCPQEVILNLDTTLLVPQSVNLHASCHPKLYLHPRAKASRQLPKMSPGSVLFTNELQSWESDKAASWLDLAKAYGGQHRSRSGTIKIPQDFICFLDIRAKATFVSSLTSYVAVCPSWQEEVQSLIRATGCRPKASLWPRQRGEVPICYHHARPVQVHICADWACCSVSQSSARSFGIYCGSMPDKVELHNEMVSASGQVQPRG